jgi:hypothetical protein
MENMLTSAVLALVPSYIAPGDYSNEFAVQGWQEEPREQWSGSPVSISGAGIPIFAFDSAVMTRSLRYKSESACEMSREAYLEKGKTPCARYP